MASEPSHVSQYDPDTTEKIIGATAEVLRAIGFASHHAVLIGGVVPGMLVPDPPRGVDRHVGTIDIDLCLSIALIEGDTGEYGRIEHEIRKLEFEIGQDGSFQWKRSGHFPLTLEFFCPTAETRGIGMYRPKASDNPRAKHNLGSRLSPFAIPAGELIVADVVEVERDVRLPTTDELVPNFKFRITGIVGFLAAKNDALYERDKAKDAYDIVWLLEAWDGGPAGAGDAVREHPVYAHGGAKHAIDRLIAAFKEAESIGPGAYARFLTTGGMTAEETAALRLRARGAVDEFAAAIGPDTD